MLTIEEIIKTNISLKNENSGGWHTVTCPVCNDYKPRAGFKFSNGGNDVVYHCFNEDSCGGAYKPGETSGFMSSNMINVLNAFNVPKKDYLELIFQNTLSTKIDKEQIDTTDIFPEYIDFPSQFEDIHTSKSIVAEMARLYLEERHINTNYKMYVYPYERTNDPQYKKWLYRLIIPAYRNNKVIYYQGRNLLEDKRRKYEGPGCPFQKVLYNFNELFQKSQSPLLVCESVLDGLSISDNNFVSVMSSNLTMGQLTLLINSPRKKIIIPDQFGNGSELAIQGIDHGWGVSFPNLKGCKDINEAVIKYGNLYVLHEILSNIKYDYEAKMFLNFKQVGL